LGKKKSAVIINLLEQYLDNTVKNQFSHQDDTTISYFFPSRKEWSKNFVPDLLSWYLKESLLP